MGAALLVGALVALMKLVSMRTYDPTNPRSRPNGYLMSHSVVVDRPPDEVFDFVTCRLGDHYLDLSDAHERFDVVDGDGLTRGSVVLAVEFIEGRGVAHENVVQDVIPDRTIYLSSTPSRIYERSDGRRRQIGTCDTHIYFDVEDEHGATTLTQTVVIEMPDFLVKFLADLASLRTSGNAWQDHLVEEPEALKVLIERDA